MLSLSQILYRDLHKPRMYGVGESGRGERGLEIMIDDLWVEPFMRVFMVKKKKDLVFN